MGMESNNIWSTTYSFRFLVDFSVCHQRFGVSGIWWLTTEQQWYNPNPSPLNKVKLRRMGCWTVFHLFLLPVNVPEIELLFAIHLVSDIEKICAPLLKQVINFNFKHTISNSLFMLNFKSKNLKNTVIVTGHTWDTTITIISSIINSSSSIYLTPARTDQSNSLKILVPKRPTSNSISNHLF